MDQAATDARHMQRALQLAALGRGLVEPNPMVGCVLAHGDRIVGEGWHHAYGGHHAEVNAIESAGAAARGATLYVTLEPCCHHGKTPPCTDAVLRSGVQRVVIAVEDPFPQVSGQGIQRLRSAGLQVDVGLLAAEALDLNAPFEQLIRQRRPWIIAKWAMTLDGKLATRSGQSQWISSPASREIVHQLRGRMDAILVGSGTAIADNPLLTARPAGPRTAARVVFDSQASLSTDSQLAQTANDFPTVIVTGPTADPSKVTALHNCGCEIIECVGETHQARLAEMLTEFGRRRWTNVLVEGGNRLLGLLWDMQTVNEVHAFVAPKIWGGADAPSPIGGLGIDSPESGATLHGLQQQIIDSDIYMSGRVTYANASEVSR
ncbi:MAG: bifunctional diaminohydroxyphosphoribosylaminopyrimidine deaminase/5-amino-6-(5-phosphoribosylamino)uracil reductase RibD [Planctomycetales bacterium]|nr:bifunctional diaminohydroxyphosphoribosylaminopyrimidine deaminase/5-amino-6-(5-phosphoribosylamino)uracil reductase RibD [Planctomycetales bacterium]MCA9167511.1 bifunctional diaminohydroxyphosphoribosylaminopyrimidine deaminase/5-amino-6-(5-phosphoribosylamino)uracil reductase RibD [Planctomycetales bacterium]